MSYLERDNYGYDDGSPSVEQEEEILPELSSLDEIDWKSATLNARSDSAQLTRELRRSLDLLQLCTLPDDDRISLLVKNNFEWIDLLVDVVADFDIPRDVRALGMKNILFSGNLFPEIYRKLSELCAFEKWIFADLQDTEDPELVYLSLCFIRSLCKEGLPDSEKKKLGYNLCSFVIELTFQFEGDDALDQVYLAALQVMVSISRQFPSMEENRIVKKMKEHERVSDLGQKLVHLINRESDPFVMEGCLDLLKEIFSSTSTCNQFFYTNDVIVLLDVILRQIEDLGGGREFDRIRHLYLELLELVLMNGPYLAQEVKHRPEDIVKLLREIAKETQKDPELARRSQQVLNSCNHILRM